MKRTRRNPTDYVTLALLAVGGFFLLKTVKKPSDTTANTGTTDTTGGNTTTPPTGPTEPDPSICGQVYDKLVPLQLSFMAQYGRRWTLDEWAFQATAQTGLDPYHAGQLAQAVQTFTNTYGRGPSRDETIALCAQLWPPTGGW